MSLAIGGGMLPRQRNTTGCAHSAVPVVKYFLMFLAAGVAAVAGKRWRYVAGGTPRAPLTLRSQPGQNHHHLHRNVFCLSLPGYGICASYDEF